MFQKIRDYFNGEMVDVVIVDLRQHHNGVCNHHMLVHCPDGTRKCINGWLGTIGETVKVNTWSLWSYS